MMELGKKQELIEVRRVDFGVYLAEEMTDDREKMVLLPAKQVPEGLKVGDRIGVFLYRDSDDRLIATVNEPLLQVGEVGLLTVKDTTRVGAFLDWGLEKDLFLPYHEQRGTIERGEKVLVGLYIDKSSRLCATMNVYPYLKKHSPYDIGDEVQGRVYEISRNFGVFIAVDDQYSALIPKKDAQGHFHYGEILKLRVTGVREDGRLCVTTKQKAYLQMGPDAEKILAEIRRCGGTLGFDDKASPELIDRTFGISKAAFKRAVGHLLKERRIEKHDGKLIEIR
jgi:predicted RNA-binding protein (virulence factor B family)